MSINTWREAEIDYRRERLAADFARGRRALLAPEGRAARDSRRGSSATFRVLRRALHVAGA